jgi:hypothetical protein
MPQIILWSKFDEKMTNALASSFLYDGTQEAHVCFDVTAPIQPRPPPLTGHCYQKSSKKLPRTEIILLLVVSLSSRLRTQPCRNILQAVAIIWIYRQLCRFFCKGLRGTRQGYISSSCVKSGYNARPVKPTTFLELELE